MLSKFAAKTRKGMKEIRKFNYLPLSPCHQQGGVLLNVVFVGAFLTGVSYTILNTTDQQTRVAKKLVAEHTEAVLQRTLDDAASSPYALVESAKANNDLANCTAKAGTCNANANFTNFRLYNSAGTMVARGGRGLGYDSLGRRCNGRGCSVEYISRSSFSVSCRAGTPSCNVASEILVNYTLSQRQGAAEVEIVNETKNVGAIECGAGFALSGFENGGQPICVALSTGYVEKHTDPTQVPTCSNSSGEIPANVSHRPPGPRPPVGSNEWNNWVAADWFAGTGDQGKGPWICQEEAYQLSLHCSNKYDPLLSNPAHLVCADFYDHKNSNSPLIEFDSNCNMTYVGCRGTLGCLAPDSMITMADGTKRRIDSLKAGDLVYNPVTKGSQAIKRILEGVERIALLRIDLKGHEQPLTVTQTHPMLTPAGIRQAKDLRAPQRIAIGDGQYRDIEKITTLHNFRGYVWNFELEGKPTVSDHVILANGIQTGDLFIQENFSSLVKKASRKNHARKSEEGIEPPALAH